MTLDKDTLHMLAARNNAIWCDTVCRAHGVPGEIHESCWVNPHDVPPFHSNMTTLQSEQGVAAQLEQIARLERERGEAFGLKDGFCRLDLADRGFRVLFEASWIWREADKEVPGHADETLEWSAVESAAELAVWEAAWRGHELHAEGSLPPRQFPEALLEEPGVVFYAGRDSAGAVAAVGIANRTRPVVGVSNVFACDEGKGPWWPGLIRAVGDGFPGLPIVGYERGADLERALGVGFEVISPLRVWCR